MCKYILIQPIINRLILLISAIEIFGEGSALHPTLRILLNRGTQVDMANK